MTDRIDIGDGHSITYSEYDGEIAGIVVFHHAPDGSECSGWVPFRGSAWERSFNVGIPSWDVVQKDPLTLTPSILCRACGDHGFIRNGKWVRA